MATNGVARAAEKTYKRFIDIIEPQKMKKSAMKTASKYADRATDMVKDHPVAAVAIGLGVGYLLMRIVRR